MVTQGTPPLSFSKVPGNPSFRKAAVNAVALVPLLSNKDDGAPPATKSALSFVDLLESLRRHNTAAPQIVAEDELLLVIPNSSLTRPGDWRYNETPLKAFHWQHGCQRLMLFDGRPQESRPAHDRLINQSITRDWIDLCPSRRTAAVVGVLNLHDCESHADLHRAEEELHQWALRFATPPYEVTAHGRNGERDKPVERLFVFDSFDDECQKIDLSKSKMGNSILAFPPSDPEHSVVMDLHLNVVVNDLAVAIFRALEERIKESDKVSRSKGESTTHNRTSFGRLISGQSAGNETEEPSATSPNLSLSNMATLVSPENKLAKETSPASDKAFPKEDSSSPKVSKPVSHVPIANKSTAKIAAAETQLMTPLDENWDFSQLSVRDVEAIRKRDIGRREKAAADLSLLAGSPLDAYERYLKAAELCKTGTPDPLWYAMALEGCAAAHIAMAEGGGYNVDEYLENNFQLPEEIMALAKKEDEKRQTSLTATNKQTLPEVVFALCEEALNIVNRSEILACFYAELLLKMALYSSESAEGHLRCRWGEGPGCFSGEPGNPPRWERTSVSKLKFGELKTKDDRDMVEINTFNRVKKFCELLHEAVSIGNLDPASRVDVAARSARFCLEGVQASQWKRPSNDRIKLYRKASFFSVVAAEALTAVDGSSTQTPENLWLLCSQLLSRTPNTLEKPGSYAWATLRASVLHSLSLLGSGSVSREAAELLLSLLTEISPNLPKQGAKKVPPTPLVASSKNFARSLSTNTDSSAIHDQIEDSDTVGALYVNTQEGDSANYTNRFANRIRESFTTMTAASSLLAVEAKWADEDVVVPVFLPMSNSSSQMLSLGCVWQKIDFRVCAIAQRECIERIMALRKTTSTTSSALHTTTDIYGTDFNTLPLYVSSAMTVEEDKALELTCFKKKVKPKAESGAMSTFFNPFAKKKDSKVSVTRVAGEEERVMVYHFGNSLAVPVRVSQCRLEFQNDVGDRVKSPTLAFDIPAKASSFTVRFPFTVVPPSETESEIDADIFEVKGISLSCMNRSFSLPVAPDPKTRNTVSKELPAPASNDPYRNRKKLENATDETSTLKLEVYPCQPNPKITFAESDASVDTALDMGLTDGQVVATPLFRLSNYSGPSGGGHVERLQISVLGIPGSQECVIYDSETPEETESVDDTGDDFLRELFEQENPPTLKFRLVSVKSLTLSAINVSDESSPCQLAFQLAASHNLGHKIPSEAAVSIRIKFSGRPTASSEVWRIREIPIKIAYIKGPRIASLSLRPDLIQESSYTEVCKILASRSGGTSVQEEKPEGIEGARMNTRVGLDSGVHVCSGTILAILVVVNETREDIVLSRKAMSLGGFEGHPLDTLLLRSNVTSKVPILVPRLPRCEKVSDLVDALLDKTTLVWETAKAIKSTGHFARGRITIPQDILYETVVSTPSLGPSLCETPCQVVFRVNGKESSKETVTVGPGQPVDLSMSVVIAPWVPREIIERCTFTFEFFCFFKDHKKLNIAARDHLWCGKVQHSFSGKSSAMEWTHTSKILLIQTGRYYLSGCIRISQGRTEETWLAPVTSEMMVDTAHLPSQ